MELLVVMSGLSGGGAEKSLVSFLATLQKTHAKDVNVDLLVFRPEGLFLSQVPENVHWIFEPKECFCMSYSITSEMFWKNVTGQGLAGKINHYAANALKKNESELDGIQRMWKHWIPYIPKSKKHYDVAISYMHGATNYFVIDKCNADKKYLYVHHEYEELMANRDFDRAYFSAADGIITVSPRCVSSILKVFPEFKEKVVSIDNIFSPSLICSMAEKEYPAEYKDIPKDMIKLVSIGRMNPVKRFDRAIEAAKILKDHGIEFRWFLVGEGEEKEKLQALVEKLDLLKEFVFVGVKSNPYPYIKNADIFVQTSDNEGKSLVLDEAKILHCPVVVTNYMTVADAVSNEKNGLIADFDPQSVAQCIMRYVQEPELYNRIQRELASHEYGNESEIEKYMMLWKK